MNNQQLSRIKVSGFKSIKDCDINLSNINVLIGSNGAGKSNFISIFKLLQNVLEKNLQLYTATSGGANTLMFNGRKQTEQINFEFFFSNNSYEFNLIPTNLDNLIFKNENFKFNGIKQLTPKQSGYEESKWEELPEINKFEIETKTIFNGKKWRVYHFHDTGLTARVKQTNQLSNNAELQFDAGNLAPFLFCLKNEYPSNYSQIVSTIKLVAPYFEDFYLQPTLNGDIILRWAQKGCDNVFNANQLSDGTLRFICLTTLLLQPHTLQPETIIIDEPELGLHPYAITLLSDIIKQVSFKKQIIISTQSVELLNNFSAENIIVVNRNLDNSSTFKRLNPAELDDWLNDDYTVGDLWKKNIIGGRP